MGMILTLRIMKTGHNKKSKQKSKRAKSKRVSSLKKKKRVIRKRVIKSFSKLSKRRRKDVYDIDFKRGKKSRDEIIEAIEKTKLNIDLPSDSAKITFIAQYRNKKSSISYIYDQLDDPEQIKEAMHEIARAIFQKKIPRSKKDSLKRMSRLKQYISRIIIDFETE